MSTYLPADVKILEYSEDPDGQEAVWIDVEFIDPSEFSLTETSVRQGVNQRKQVTAMKDVEVDATLFDHSKLTALRLLEQAKTEVAWRVTLLDGTIVQTELAPFSIDREITQADGLQGYQILSAYGTDGSEEPTDDTYPE